MPIRGRRGRNFLIKSVPKHQPSGTERAVTVESTLARARVKARELGVTRLANVTGLDRIGIPVYSAILPDSDDPISSYGGKGLTPADAQTSALMEAIERQTALRARPPLVESSYRALRDSSISVADPASFNEKLRKTYSEDRSYLWVEGHDLVSGDPVMVPAGLACYGQRFMGAASPFPVNSTNGLASGNCFEEAVCHALCELIERDSWTLAEFRSRWIPHWRRQKGTLPAGDSDDLNAYPSIDLRHAGDPFPGLLAKFEAAGLDPVIRDVTSDLGICAVMAAVADDSVPGFPQAHMGLGAHPEARIAVARALTELAQSRALDYQASREDMAPAETPPKTSSLHLQRLVSVNPNRWHLRNSDVMRSFREMSSVENPDIADDIRLILARLIRHKLNRVIVVDYSEPGGFAVVRVMVPGLEYWALDQGKVGSRALRFWNQHVR